MPKNQNVISIEAVERFAKKLSDAPVKAKTSFSTRETVQMHKDAILHAVNERGYTYQDIAAWLAEVGAKISVSTLHSYLRDPKKKKVKAASKLKTNTKNTISPPPQFEALSYKTGPINEADEDDIPHDIGISTEDQKQKDRSDTERSFRKLGGLEDGIG